MSGRGRGRRGETVRRGRGRRDKERDKWRGKDKDKDEWWFCDWGDCSRRLSFSDAREGGRDKDLHRRPCNVQPKRNLFPPRRIGRHVLKYADSSNFLDAGDDHEEGAYFAVQVMQGPKRVSNEELLAQRICNALKLRKTEISETRFWCTS